MTGRASLGRAAVLAAACGFAAAGPGDAQARSHASVAAPIRAAARGAVPAPSAPHERAILAWSPPDPQAAPPLARRAAATLARHAAVPLVQPAAAPPDPWLAEDKARHLFASLTIGAIAYGAATGAGLEWPDAGVAAGALAGGAGVAKEFRDRARGRPFSVRDLAWDALGVGAALLLASRARR
jgi:uncharacterized protein YfiM (DUF2279 family)